MRPAHKHRHGHHWHHNRWHNPRHHRSYGSPINPLAGILFLVLAIFLISKAWWLIFILPALLGPLGYASGMFKDFDCDNLMPDTHDDDPRKQKRQFYEDDDPFYPEDDDRLHRARPVKRDDEGYYDGETVIL